MDHHQKNPGRSGRGGATVVLLLVGLSCLFWGYQGVVRRHRHEWAAAVKSLGLTATIMPASRWTSQMYVPGPQQLLERDVVIVMVDSESQGQALLTAPSSCPNDVKIYAFDGLSTARYAQLEERFPTAVVFTRITD
ncbi:hypothetical protein Pan44_16770 [Caulifigura coniformis]|uniref:Uncharacterized protein n=1 Tax=Caulifigura coniformis TaxID=2527983 RepID=A0A517SC19_9PLAN|nr:hypothetical protein [Caulifigura coniformis]QDT53654.1 hypothetical protein Pan44_16770 [Caulifigura coniformis]